METLSDFIYDLFIKHSKIVSLLRNQVSNYIMCTFCYLNMTKPRFQRFPDILFKNRVNDKEKLAAGKGESILFVKKRSRRY